MRYVAAAFLSLMVCGSAFGETIHVAAAISMKDALTDAKAGFEKESGDTVEFSFGASGALEAQIKSGAEVDVFISAANKQMDELTAGKMVDVGTRRDVVRNSLVLVVPSDSKLELTGFADLGKPEVKKISTGEPKTVPAGDYAMQVFKSLKIEDAVAGKVVYGANVRQVLSYVERGEVDAGVVYATDAKESGEKVKVVAVADEASHKAIVYPGAVVTASKHKEDAGKFLDYLGTAEGAKFLTDRGFVVAAANGAATQKGP